MTGLAAVYLFLLGLAAGLALLTLTAYRRVSPTWLKWLLLGLGLFVISRYVAMALFTAPDAPDRFWAFRRCWFATSIGLTFSSVMAIDHVVRHPAMTPKKLLQWMAPFLLAYASVILFGQFEPQPDRVIGWIPRLTPVWQRVLSTTHSLFLIGFLAGCALLAKKIPSRPIRRALAALAAGQLLLGVDGVVLAFGGWYFRPYLYSEMLTLAALWFAYDTGTRLQGGG